MKNAPVILYKTSRNEILKAIDAFQWLNVLGMNSSFAAGTDLWKAFKQGDGESYAELMERNYRPLYSYGTKITADDELVKYCIQETFLELWHRRATLGTNRSPRFYLLRMLQRRIQRALLHNRVLYKSLGISLNTDFSVVFSLEVDRTNREEQREKARQLAALVDTLSPRQKQLIYLRFYQELNVDEVADLMIVNRKSVYNSLRETLLRLRDTGQDLFSTKPYDTYEITDFLLDDEFVDWVKFPTRESDRSWQQWLLNHPAQATVVQDARFWITNLTVSEQLPTDRAVSNALEQTYAQIPNEQPPVVVSTKRRWFSFAWRTAAAVLLSVGISWYTVSMRNTGYLPGNGTELVLRQNNFPRPVSLRLPDGSQVVLAPDGQVQFPPQFSAQVRDVMLTGEASFDVVRQPRQPFVVHVGTINIKAVSTNFSIRSLGQNGDVNVSVKSGSVIVSKATGTAGPGAVLLTPDQQVTFSARGDVLQKGLVETSVQVYPKSQGRR